MFDHESRFVDHHMLFPAIPDNTEPYRENERLRIQLEAQRQLAASERVHSTRENERLRMELEAQRQLAASEGARGTKENEREDDG